MSEQANEIELEATQNACDNVRVSTRLRTQTEQGKNYNIDNLSKRYTSTVKRINRQSSHVEELIETNNDDIILSQSTILDNLLAEADEIHKRLLEILEDDPQTQQIDRHEETDALVFETKRKVCQWMKENETHSKTSSRKSRSRSRASSRKSLSKAPSVKSETSGISKTSSKLASLKLEEEMLQKVQETKQKELEIRFQLEKAKMNSEKAKLQKRIAKAQLEEGEKQFLNQPENVLLHQTQPPLLPQQTEVNYPSLKEARLKTSGEHNQDPGVDSVRPNATKGEIIGGQDRHGAVAETTHQRQTSAKANERGI